MPSVEIKTLAEEDYPLWDAFTEKTPQGSFFHRSEWANIISMATDRPLRILVCQRGDEILAGLMLFENSKWGFTMATPLPLFPFNGPLIRAMDDAGRHKAIARTLKYSDAFARFLMKHYHYWVIDTCIGFYDIRSFQWTGCQVQPVFTYQIKLNNNKDLWSGYNQGIRRKIKEAGNLGISIMETTNIGNFIEMYQKSYHRHQMRPPADISLIEKILAMIIKLPQVKIYTATSENKIISGRVIVLDQRVVYDLLAGSDDSTGLGAAYIVHHLLKKYSGTHHLFDFMGAGHREIERFKRSFGGSLNLGFRVSGKADFPLSFMLKLRKANLTRRRRL